MTPNKTIYFINQSSELIKAWRELSEPQKLQVIKECETAEESMWSVLLKKLRKGKEDYFNYGSREV
jgi:hypothetical protein